MLNHNPYQGSKKMKKRSRKAIKPEEEEKECDGKMYDFFLCCFIYIGYGISTFVK
jgi:hypothetical protein